MTAQKIRSIENNKLMKALTITYGQADRKRAEIKKLGISVDEFIQQRTLDIQNKEKTFDIHINITPKGNDKITGELITTWLKAQLENSSFCDVKIN